MDYLRMIGHSLGFIALVLGFCSYQAKSQKGLLLWQTANSAVFVLHYFLIGAPSACVLNLVNIIRNLVYYGKGKTGRVAVAYPVIFSLVAVLFGVVTWEGPHSLLVTFGIAINSICVSLNNVQGIRKSILLTSSLVFLYDAFVFSVGGMVYELVAIGSSVIGLWRYRKR